MDRDEILRKSRKENNDKDFVEEEVLAKANSIALGVGLIVCGLISVLCSVLTERGGEPAVWVVEFSILAATMLFKFIKLKKRHELLLGLLYLGFCIFFFVIYLRGLLGAGSWTMGLS